MSPVSRYGHMRGPPDWELEPPLHDWEEAERLQDIMEREDWSPARAEPPSADHMCRFYVMHVYDTIGRS